MCNIPFISFIIINIFLNIFIVINSVQAFFFFIGTYNGLLWIFFQADYVSDITFIYKRLTDLIVFVLFVVKSGELEQLSSCYFLLHNTYGIYGL